MNLYLRFFDEETLVSNFEEALFFLRDVATINLSAQQEADFYEFVYSKDVYPTTKRYKVNSHQYFIVIKTEACNMQDFKDKKAVHAVSSYEEEQKMSETYRLEFLRDGWYEGSLDFKRVVVNHVGKCEYRDTNFTIRCKASSMLECYKKIVNYLSEVVDRRSQFPAARGKYFNCKYLGKAKLLL